MLIARPPVRECAKESEGERERERERERRDVADCDEHVLLQWRSWGFVTV